MFSFSATVRDGRCEGGVMLQCFSMQARRRAVSLIFRVGAAFLAPFFPGPAWAQDVRQNAPGES